VSATRPLADLRRGDASRFGGKSASLGELLAAGVPVPPGFAVASGAALDDALRGEVSEAYAALGDDQAVAVRSSALGEDGAEASFAGQHDTFLWVRGADAVWRAIGDCHASLENPEAVAYRQRVGAGRPAMGVTVQLMVDALVSGVMFTCNPVSGDPSTVAVNASWGLGSAVVAGEVTPDEYRVNKISGDVTARTIGPKHVEDLPDPSGAGTVRREVAAERREAACLDDAALDALLEVARRVERHFGSHQDIEWALARGDRQLLVLQSRPVTTRPRPEPAAPRSALSLVMETFGAKRDG
jgi:pyruvate, water dikinase